MSISTRYLSLLKEINVVCFWTCLNPEGIELSNNPKLSNVEFGPSVFMKRIKAQLTKIKYDIELHAIEIDYEYEKTLNLFMHANIVFLKQNEFHPEFVNYKKSLNK